VPDISRKILIHHWGEAILERNSLASCKGFYNRHRRSSIQLKACWCEKQFNQTTAITNEKPPHATSPAAPRNETRSPQGRIFSANTQSAMATIQNGFIKPPTNSKHIKAQQQPRQETPSRSPSRHIAPALRG
jgi:hypothetical protein